MNTPNISAPKIATHLAFVHPAPKAFLTVVCAIALLSSASAEAQTTEAWASASDNYTNGPVGGDWNPAITGSPTNWPDNFNGSASSALGYIVVITNNGTCNYTGSPTGNPNYTNTINDFYIGGTGNGTGGGGVTNTFSMSGGSLTLSDTAGPAFTVGGNASGGVAGAASTNFFTMTGGTLIVTNAFTNGVVGDCAVGFGTNSVGVMNFNGGTAILSDLTIGGHGAGTVNIAGANVTLWAVVTRPVSFDTLAGGSGTLNITSGTLTATNGLVTMGQGTIAKLTSTINMSGGVFNVGKIQYNGGAAATNIVNFSGGTIYFYSTTGYGRNGATVTNRFIMSGGTLSCGNGIATTLSGLIPTILTNTPGPGLVTFAPPAGGSINLAPAVSGLGAINVAGPGLVTYTAANTYTGDTTVNGGILAMGTGGSVVGRIIVGAGATFDLSPVVSYTLAAGQVLSNSTPGAVIDGALNTGSGVLSLLYSSGNPSFILTTNNSSVTNAAVTTLTLSPATTLKINNAGSALAPGNYIIISTNSEGAAVAGTPPGTVTVTGGGIQAGDTAALSIGGDGQLYLLVAALPPPPTIGSYLPVTYTSQFILYAGASPTFQVSATSAVTINYQWFTNGVGVGWGTNASLTLTNVHASLVLTNYCVVSNYAGSTTSIVWTASVIAPPAAYPQSVVAASPIGYWRLDEGNDNGGGDDGYIANDYVGGNDGIYTNVTLGNQGYNSTADPSDTSAAFGDVSPYTNNLAGQIQGIDFAATNGANAEFTVEAWVQGQPGNEVTGGTVVTKGVYNFDDEFSLGMDSAGTKHYRFYVRNAAGTVYTADSAFTPDGNWHHLVGVCDEANGAVSLYIDGKLEASTAIPENSGEYETPSPMLIGAGADKQGNSYQFYGNINDVAVFNYALSSTQVATQYGSADVAPALNPAPPSSVIANGEGTLTIPAGAVGTPPLYYWWYDESGSTNVVSGSTNGALLNAALTVNSVPLTWNKDMLDLIVSNAFGGTSFAVALTVYTNAPIITQNLPTPLQLLSGVSYTYVFGVAGASPDYYQWYSNAPPNGVAIADQTNLTDTIMAPAVGVTNFYFIVATNQFGAVTSTVSEVIGVGPPTSAYATNILALNPVGYWPMHEVEAAAHGDIETNYGSIGVLGTGYYGDWIGLQGIIHNNAGALANDPDTSVDFNYPGAANTGDATNSLIVPHNSPLSTLNPPFTVECWFYPNNTSGGDVWAQAGAVGLNNGPNYAGIRCYWHSSHLQLECYNGQSGNTLYAGPSIDAFGANEWLYVVVVDDGTNLDEYVNGSFEASNSPANYAPDYWTPLSIASGFGFNRNVNGGIDEFAVYTNALSLTDIANHYNDGLTGGVGVYKADVLADNPVIYLRMDSPPYTSPNLLPELINYGSARNVGFYTPGTFPGAVSGPSYPGFPAGGLSGTNVAALSGVSSYADAGYAAAYNPMGAVPFSVTATFRGNPTDVRDQTIVGHTTSSWRLWMNTTGNLEWQIAGTTLTSAGIYNDGDWHQVVAVYSPASGPAVTGTNLLYVDGVLDSSVSTVSTNGISGSTADVFIGGDPQYTNNPDAFGQQFAGQICEVALFPNALSSSQVQTLYNVSPVVPYIDGQPISGRTVYGGAGSYIYFGVDAGGSQSLAYQWYFNTNPSYSGATQLVDGAHYANSATYEVTVTNLTTADSGYYFVVITNNYGSVTSVLASLTVTNNINTNPTNILFSVSNNQLMLNWPADHIGWELQAQTNRLSSGIGSNWVPVAGSTNVNQVAMPVNSANGCVFYRLVYPPQ